MDNEQEYLNKDYYESVNRLLSTLKASDGYVPVSDLAKRFEKIDEYFEHRPWNLLQILANINIIVPIYLDKE